MEKMMSKGFQSSATRQLNVVSREIIKPETPMPPHPKSYIFSSLDQFTRSVYIPMVFFYPNHGCDSKLNPTEKSNSLKKSLAKTLTQYYPLAGRLVDGVSVDCNDEGVEFIETRIKCPMSEILENPQVETVNEVFPTGLVWGQMPEGSSLVVVQLNYFDCGGMAIAVCMSHKIGDTCTLCNFLTYWAATTCSSGEQVSPHFISWPSNDSVLVPELGVDADHGKNTNVTKRLVFQNSKIAQLKAMATNHGVQINHTRVQVLSALLYKCAIDAFGADSGTFRPSVLMLLVNMRSKMVPPLPSTSFGNLFGKITIPSRTQSEITLSALSDQMRNGIMQRWGIENVDGNEWWSTIHESISNNFDTYMCSSYCKFPFYELDFGWGKPIKATIGSPSAKNYFVLMDTPSGDGIEALVSLEEKSMANFESHEDILAFSS